MNEIFAFLVCLGFRMLFLYSHLWKGRWWKLLNLRFFFWFVILSVIFLFSPNRVLIINYNFLDVWWRRAGLRLAHSLYNLFCCKEYCLCVCCLGWQSIAHSFHFLFCLVFFFLFLFTIFCVKQASSTTLLLCQNKLQSIRSCLLPFGPNATTLSTFSFCLFAFAPKKMCEIF